MDSETIKANDILFFDYINNRNIEEMEKWIDRFVAEDFINHSPELDVPKDKQGLKEMFRKLIQLFQDFNINIKEMVFENDILCFRFIVRGIGGDEGIMGLAMVKYKNGKIIDRRVFTEGNG